MSEEDKKDYENGQKNFNWDWIYDSEEKQFFSLEYNLDEENYYYFLGAIDKSEKELENIKKFQN